MTQTKRPNYLIWMACILLFLSAYSFLTRPKEETASYAEVVQLFEQEKVKSFTIRDTTLTLKLREPVSGRTELTKELYDFDLFYDDLGGLIEEQKKAGILEDYDISASHSPNYLAMVLPYVVAVGGLIAIWYFLSMRSSGGGGDRMAKFGNATFKRGSESGRKTTFADVAGADEEKEELSEIVDFLRFPQKFVELGARIPKGVLLVGPPGTGKTLLARAVAGEADVEFLSLSGSDFVEMYVGVGASRVRDTFKKARKLGRCVIFIDEIDSLGRSRGANSSDERDQTLNALLGEMSGFRPAEGVIVIGATNRAEMLDPALLRPGRFDRRIEVAMPDRDAREKILRLHARGKPMDADVDLSDLAARTVLFSGASLENLLNEAAICAARRRSERICEADIESAYLTLVAGSDRSIRMSEEERRLIALHEAGHAVISRLLAPEDRIRRVSIVPSGNGAAGYNLSIPAEKTMYTRGDLENRICVLLAGRAAETLYAGEGGVTGGASNDLKRATELACQMAGEMGMGRRPYAAENVLQKYGCGAETGADAHGLLEELYERTLSLLSAHADTLRTLAQRLLADEALDEAAVDGVLAALREEAAEHTR